MSDREKSAWTPSAEESVAVHYWKYRVRRAETMGLLAVLGAFMLGIVVGVMLGATM